MTDQKVDANLLQKMNEKAMEAMGQGDMARALQALRTCDQIL